MSGPVGAVIVAVGDELLLGTTVDTNGPWLGRELASLGIPVVRRAVIGDVSGDIAAELERCLGRVQLLVFMGGLGPTPDDRTRESVAEALGRPLVKNAELLRELEQRFARHGLGSLPKSNHRQVMVPEGGLVLPNPRGTAPGLWIDLDETVVVLLPGPPREVKGIFRDELRPSLRERFADRLLPVHHETVYTTGIAESDLADRVEAVFGPGDSDVEIAFLPSLWGVGVRFTVRGRPPTPAHELIGRAKDKLAPVLSPYRYEAESGDLVEALGRSLVEHGHTLAVAESCTGGMAGARFTRHPGASRYFLGGVIAYSDGAKRGLLDVDPAVLEREGAVSEGTAVQMVRGAQSKFGADAAIAITGIAGPDGGTDDKPVGTVWYAAAIGDRLAVECRRFAGEREAVRTRSVRSALALLYGYYRAEESDDAP